MRSALRTFTSALGLCAACYLLSTASWHQVLLLFMVASFGWCWFAFSSGLDEEREGLAPRMTPSPKKLPAGMASPAVAEAMFSNVKGPRPAPRVQANPTPRVQKVYRFPIHELTRASLSPIAEFD